MPCYFFPRLFLRSLVWRSFSRSPGGVERFVGWRLYFQLLQSPTALAFAWDCCPDRDRLLLLCLLCKLITAVPLALFCNNAAVFGSYR